MINKIIVITDHGHQDPHDHHDHHDHQDLHDLHAHHDPHPVKGWEAGRWWQCTGPADAPGNVCFFLQILNLNLDLNLN